MFKNLFKRVNSGKQEDLRAPQPKRKENLKDTRKAEKPVPEHKAAAPAAQEEPKQQPEQQHEEAPAEQQKKVASNRRIAFQKKLRKRRRRAVIAFETQRSHRRRK